MIVDRQKIQIYRMYLEAAVTEAAKKAGFASAKIGSIRYNDTEITCKITTVVDPIRKAEKEEREQRKLATIYRKDGDIITVGSIIEFGGKHYVFQGFTTRGSYLVTKGNHDKQYRISKDALVKVVA